MFLLFPKKKKRKRSKIPGLIVFAVTLAALFTAGKTVVTQVRKPSPVTSSSFQSCVISHESGGNPQIWNKQGYPYWGLYQFGKPLWTAYGGSPASWGHADASTQTQVFDSVMSHYDGCQNWFPSDGCRYPANGC